MEAFQYNEPYFKFLHR